MKLNSSDKFSNEAAPLYEFAEFSFDAKDKVLYKDGEIITLAPKACELLGVFIENAGKLISRDELMNQVWADSFVEEANLTHHISALRKALGEDNNGRKFIETIPRKGYRFVAPVSEISTDTAAKITFSERTTTHFVEESSVELPDGAKSVPVNQTITARDERKVLPAAPINDWRKKMIWVFAGLCLLATVGFAARYFWKSSNRPAFFDDSTRVSWRVAPVIEARSRAFGNISGVSLSPDGKFIAFDRRAGRKSALFAKQIGGGEAVRLTDGDFNDHTPIWFADGQRIAFHSNRDGFVGVWTLPFMGGTPALLARLPVEPTRPFEILKMSADDRRIFYKAESKMYSLDVREPSAAPVLLFEESEGIEKTFDYAVSPDETQMAFIAKVGDGFQLFTASLTDKSQKPQQITFDAGNKRFPAWFADGRQLAFSSNRSGKFQIYALDLPSGETKQLTLDAAESNQPIVSPNGEAIFFHAEDNEANVYSFSLETRTEKPHTDSTELQIFPAVAPEGNRVAFQTTVSLATLFNSDLKILRLDNGANTLTIAGRGFNPQWSPDGESLAFIRLVGAKYDLWKVSANGQNETELTTGGISSITYSVKPFAILHENFNFSPDGKQIVYASRKSGAPNVWTISTDDAKTERKWTNFENETTAVLGCHYSPDSQKIVFSAQVKTPKEKEFTVNRVYQTDGERTQIIYETKAWMRILGWSETGNEIYIAEREQGEETKSVRLLKISTAENAVPQVLARIPHTDFENFRLSPDKQNILFTAVEEDSESENLYLFSLSNAKAQRLTDNREASIYYSGAVFAPDGKRIFYSKQTGGDVYSLLSISK